MDEDIPKYLDGGRGGPSGLMTIKNPDKIGPAAMEPVQLENFRLVWKRANGGSKLDSNTIEEILKYERENKASLDSDDAFCLSNFVLLADDRLVEEVVTFGKDANGSNSDNPEPEKLRRDRLLLSSVGVLDTNREGGEEDEYNGQFRCSMISLGIFFNQIQTRDNEHVYWEAFDPNKGRQLMGVWLPTS